MLSNALPRLALAGCTAILLFACVKTPPLKPPVKTEDYSADVVVRWLNMQLDMLRVPLAEGTGSQTPDRSQAYVGITLYEALLPSMPGSKSMTGQLTDFPVMPSIGQGREYYWPAVANAALADINRKLFPTTSTQNKIRMDSLEMALATSYERQCDGGTLDRSIAYGRKVSAAVFAWASTDGSANVNPPYVPSGAVGTWISTPPNFPAAVNAYADQRRRLVHFLSTDTVLAAPPEYSTKPGSEFWNMANDVYQKSLTLSGKQTDMALYHRDAPGYPGGGTFVALLSQVLQKSRVNLKVAAIAYAKVGISQTEATCICFTYKYKLSVVRPITYIRANLGAPAWNALFATPGHPEYPSAHSTIGSAVAYALSTVFGNNFEFTMNTYAYLGFADRHYNSFEEMSKEMADSRVYAGIHYQLSSDRGRVLGQNIGKAVARIIKF